MFFRNSQLFGGERLEDGLLRREVVAPQEAQPVLGRETRQIRIARGAIETNGNLSGHHAKRLALDNTEIHPLQSVSS